MLHSLILGRKERHLVKQILKPQQGANTFVEGVFVANHNSEPKEGLELDRISDIAL